MVMPIMAFVMIFQDLGLSQAVVTSPSLTYGQLNSLFWINLTLSILIGAMFASLAPILAQFYKDQRVFYLTLALAGTAPISGLMTQHFALLGRQMRFTWLATLDVISLICGFLAAVAVAWFSPNYWALFVSFLVTMLVLLVGSWLSAGWGPGRPAPWYQVRPMLRFGGGVIGYNLSTYVARNLDKVLIGWRAGPLELGLYDRAYKLLLLPLQNLNSPIARVMVPVMSRLVDDPVRYQRVYIRMTQQIMLVALPGVVFMIATAPILIPTLLGKQWAGAVPIFAWLAIAGLHLPMSGTMAWLFLTQSRTSEYARWGLFNAVTCAAAFAIGLRWGAYGVAVAFALSDVLVRLPVLWWYVGRKGPVRTRDLYRLAAPFVAASATSACVVWNIDQAIKFYLGLSFGASYFVTGAVLAIFPEGRIILRESYNLVTGCLTQFRRPLVSDN
jgi:PST family polysaccharide transporter